MIDIAIRGGLVIDGTGAQRYQADVGILNDQIVEIGRVSAANREIDATGLIVSPGFVDPHSHSDFTMHANPLAQSTVRQGVTTEIVGNCGFSSAPITPKSVKQITGRLKGYGFEGDPEWRTMDEYFSHIEADGVSANFAFFIGHNSLRHAAGLDGDETVTDEHLKIMSDLVAESMEAGALGLSTGLEFLPGKFAKTEEIEHLAKVVGKYGGVYASHVRNRDSEIFSSMAEFLQIAKTGNVVAQLSHFNVRFDTNAPENAWERAVGMLVAEKEKGLDVAADTTPFRFGLGGMSAILPEWLLKDGYANVALALKESTVRDRLKSDCDRYWRYIHKGQWSRVRLQGSLHYPEFTGMTFPEIAKAMKQDEWDSYFDILMAAGPDMDKVLMFGENMTEAHLAEMISHPDFSLGVDGYTSVDHGALADVTQSQFPYCGHIEFLAHHVREKKTLTLESAIHKMSSKPAQRFALKTRGEIKEGWFADMVIFDADKVRSDSTLENPCVYPEGIQQVIVNGTIVVDESQHTLKRPGRVLRRK